jgi:integrase
MQRVRIFCQAVRCGVDKRIFMEHARVVSNGATAMARIRKRTWTTAKGERREVWLVDYRDGDGERRFKQFNKKRDAVDFSATAHVDVKAGKHVPDSQSATITKAAEMWLTVCRDGGPDGDPAPLEPSTWREYQRHVGYLTDPEIGIGQMKLTKLDKPAVDTFLTRLREAGRSAATARKVRGSLATLLAFAQDQKLVGRNVLREGTRRKRGQRERKDVVIPTKPELRAMLDADGLLWFRAFLAIAVYAGLRASESRGLPWPNLDLDAGIIKVRQRADFAGRIGPPKSKASNRDVDMTPSVRRLLQELYLAHGRPPDGLVFASEAGTAMNHSNIVQRFYNPLQDRLGISPRYGLHALRHAAASLFIEQGWTPKKVQKVMGHSSIQVTYDTYGHLFRSGDDDQAAMAAVEASLRG